MEEGMVVDPGSPADEQQVRPAQPLRRSSEKSKSDMSGVQPHFLGLGTFIG
jgi:hypothetical protein